MTGTGGGRTHGHRRLVIVAICVGFFSLMVSAGTAMQAQTPGSMVATTSRDSLLAIWICTVVAIVLTLWCAWVLIRDMPRPRSPIRLVASVAVAGLVVVTFVAATVSAGNVVSAGAPRNDQLREAVLDAAPACKGETPIAGAAEYGGASHPLEVISIAAGGDASGDQPDITKRAAELAALPETIASVQLVICVGHSREVTIQTCHYTLGGTYTRSGYSLDVLVYEARGGQLLEQRTFSGAAPGSCPETKAVGQDQSRGDDINWDDPQIWDFITTWLDGPVRSPAPANTP